MDNTISLTLATWVLAVFTAVLALATSAVAYFIWKYVKASREVLRASYRQAEVTQLLSESIRGLPRSFEQGKNQGQINEDRAKARSSGQRRSAGRK